MPDLPPIREDAVLNAAQFVGELQAMAAEANKAAEAMGKLLAAVKGVQDTMDRMAAGAAAAAAAENNLADAEKNVGAAAAGAAAGEQAASAAADNLGRSSAAAGAAVFSLAKFEETLATASLAAAAAERAGADAADASRDAYAGMAAAEAAAAGEAEKLAAAQAAGSLYAAQGIANTKGLAEADALLAAGERVAAEATAQHAAAQAILNSYLNMAGADSLKLATELGLVAAANDAAAGGAAKTGAAMGVQIGWLRLGAANWATFLHWVVAGSAEFLAVAIPAAVALGAGLAVAAQGAQNAYQHFSALYAATESTYSAMHQTVGSVLGLGSALQNAQNAANPGVYEILGSVVNDAKGAFQGLAGVGLQVVHMFDEFAARVTVDLKTGMGTQIQGLLSGMVTDLQQFGQVLGNLGHALLNFASAMPGLAHVLLDIATYLSSVIEVASRAGAVLTFGMALEEMYRWGGLALTMLVRLTGAMGAMNAMGATNFITRFGAAVLALTGRFAQGLTALGSWVSGLGNAEGALGRIGGALQTAGAEAAGFAESLSPGMVAAAAAGAAVLGFLAYKLITMKDATEQWIAASSQAVSKASDLNVLPAIYTQLADTLTRATAAQKQFSADSQHLSQNVVFAGRAGQIMSDSMRNSGVATTELSQHMLSLVATANTVRSNVNLLAGVFHTSAIGALALANAAGVNLQLGLTRGSTAAKIAEQQITNLKTGLGAMAAPAGEIGADMEAVGIQSQLAASKVGQVNQAMDAFIAGTTGGMNSVMQFNAALRAMGKDTVSTSQSLTGQISSISSTAAKMGYTLQGIGPKAQQSWQQFDAAVQQGNTVLDTFRTGMAEGVVTQQQYTREIQAVGGALLPFAAHNRTALAIVSQLSQEMGNPATHNLKTLASQFGITGKAAQEMATGGMERAMARMANLNTVARNLSVTISGQLDSAMAGAIVKASGLDTAYQKWATDAMNKAPAATLAGDLKAIRQAQDEVNTVERKATSLLNSNKVAATQYGGALKGAATGTGDFTAKLKDTHAALGDVVTRANNAAAAAQGLSGQTRTAATSAQGLSSNTQQATTQVRNLGSAASITQAHLGNVNNEIRTTASAASASGGPLSAMISNIGRVGASAMTASGEVRTLAASIAALQSKTITITTNMVTNLAHRAAGGPVAPGIPYLVGEEHRPEIFVPSVPGTILSGAQTQRVMSGGGGGTGQAQGGPINLTAEHHSHIYLDGKQIFTSTQTQASRWILRNRGTNDGVWVPS